MSNIAETREIRIKAVRKAGHRKTHRLSLAYTLVGRTFLAGAAPVDVASLVRDRYLPSRVAVSNRYADAMRSVVRQWSEHLGHTAMLDDFTEKNIADFLVMRAADSLATFANSFRRRLFSSVSFRQACMNRSEDSQGTLAHP